MPLQRGNREEREMKSVVLIGVLLIVVSCDIIYKKCIGKDGTHYTNGQKWFSNDPCEQYQCHDNDTDTMFVEVIRCPKYHVDSPCYLKSYPYKDYPNCCPFNECPNTGYNTGNVWNAHGHGK